MKIAPRIFDGWGKIERFVADSYRLIAPKRTVARLDATRKVKSKSSKDA